MTYVTYCPFVLRVRDNSNARHELQKKMTSMGLKDHVAIVPATIDASVAAKDCKKAPGAVDVIWLGLSLSSDLGKEYVGTMNIKDLASYVDSSVSSTEVSEVERLTRYLKEEKRKTKLKVKRLKEEAGEKLQAEVDGFTAELHSTKEELCATHEVLRATEAELSNAQEELCATQEELTHLLVNQEAAQKLMFAKQEATQEMLLAKQATQELLLASQKEMWNSHQTCAHKDCQLDIQQLRENLQDEEAKRELEVQALWTELKDSKSKVHSLTVEVERFKRAVEKEVSKYSTYMSYQKEITELVRCLEPMIYVSLRKSLELVRSIVYERLVGQNVFHAVDSGPGKWNKFVRANINVLYKAQAESKLKSFGLCIHALEILNYGPGTLQHYSSVSAHVDPKLLDNSATKVECVDEMIAFAKCIAQVPCDKARELLGMLFEFCFKQPYLLMVSL